MKYGTMEYGIFNDEGKIEGDYYSREEAEAACARYPEEEGAVVQECCPEHPEHARESCEECNADAEEAL